MQNNLVTVFGASGFLGRHTVRALAKRGWRVRAVCRKPNQANYLLPAGNVGQIHLLRGNVNSSEDVERALEGAGAAVNLVGVLHGSGAQGFDSIHAAAARRIGRAARQAGVNALAHVSALGANAKSPSSYARSKAEGEHDLLAEYPGAAILRPSVVFGPEDKFFNKFASLARFTPALPLIGGGQTKFQPVYAGDVAAAIVSILTKSEAAGTVYELGGPSVYSFEELLRFILRETGRKRMLLPVPFALAKLMAIDAMVINAVPAAVSRFFGAVPPDPILTVDQVRLLMRDNVVQPGMPGFAELGLQPQAMESVVPGYLWRYHPKGQFKYEVRA